MTAPVKDTFVTEGLLAAKGVDSNFGARGLAVLKYNVPLYVNPGNKLKS